MNLSPGDRVDRYEVLELLGRGGMGEVYRARDPKLARLVALKVLRIDRTPGTDGGARLLREARAAAALSHPNVLSVFDVGEVTEPEALRGMGFIAMELVVGKSLRDYIGDDSVSITQRIEWMRDVAKALAAAHDAGIVHRDVKPENVMVRFDGVVKVLDFGIARRAGSALDVWSSTEAHSVPTMKNTVAAGLGTLTERGGVVGTPFYMAPEQLRGEVLDGRADQFSWGVVAYELLTGVPPWTRKADALAIAAEILSREPPDPREKEPRLPAGFADVIVRALSKQSGARFLTMGDLLAASERSSKESAEDRPSAKRRDAQRLPRSARRAVWRVVFGSAALLSFCVVIFSRLERKLVVANSPDASLSELSEEHCESNAACSSAHAGGAWRCHSTRHVCVPIESSDCRVYCEPRDLQHDDTVWFGALIMGPLTPLNATTDPSYDLRALELARREFAASLGSSQLRAGDLHARSIGLVVCQDGRNRSRAARHLAEDVEVPAVISSGSPDSVLETVPAIFLPARILSFIALAQATELTKIPQPEHEPRLVWRSTLTVAGQDPPLSHLVSDILEPKARSRPGGIQTKPLHFAVVRDVRAHAFGTHSFRDYRFNGKYARENGDDFRQFVLDGTVDGGDMAVFSEIADFHPQIVWPASYGLPIPAIVEPIEARWRTGARPYYILGSDFAKDVDDFIGFDAERRHRFFAVTNVSSTLPNEEFVMRYNFAFPATPVRITAAPQPPYDAFYILAYAVHSLGNEPVTGPRLSEAIDRLLPPGLPIEVGPSDIVEGFRALREGAKIDLDGALGHLDFDRSTGEAPVDYAILCAGVDDRGHASGSIESGLVYDATTETLRGTLRCP